MMKYLLVLLVVVVGLYALFGRSRRVPPPAPGKPQSQPPAAMLSCAHCGLHLPRDEAIADAAGRFYCGEAHRLAGPR